jgi:hypothetical protein
MTYMEQDIKMETVFGDASGRDEGKGLWACWSAPESALWPEKASS